MIRHSLASAAAFLVAVSVITPTFAGPTGSETTTTTTTTVHGAAERELARRYDRAERIGREAIAAGERALKEKDYETAFAQFKLACDNIPNSPNTRRLYHRALDGLCESGVKLAEQRIAEGRYADAEATLKIVLSDQYDPRCREAVVILARLETPGYYNRTITPKFRANVEEVKRLLLEADGFYETGRYDLAFKRYEQVLNIDPYNIAARKGEEKVNLARDNSALAGYNEARSRAIWKLDLAWSNPVRKFGTRESFVIDNNQSAAAGTQRIQTKLNQIIIPRLEFREASIREAVDYLRKRSIELDNTGIEPRGVNIVLKLESAPGVALPPPEAAPAPPIPGLEPLPGAAPAAPVAAPALAPINPNEARITIALSNIPLVEALKYITELANLKFKVEPYAVSIVPQGTPTEVLLTKEYKVPPGFIGTVGGSPAGSDALAPAAPADATKGGSAIAGRRDAKEFLIAQGVLFPPGASATYIAATSRLVVRNTQENLDLIDTLISTLGTGGPVQVEIESKFVEISQNNLKELSFDWLVGAANVPKSGSLFVSGGTGGNSPGVDPNDFPFVAPGDLVVGDSPLTAANRSGSLAISQNAIDALLFGTRGGSLLAPAVGALAGVFTDPQFQVVIRALNQKKGVDLLSAPRVTAKSGQRAVIEIIREFRYPTEFDPPQIPQNFGTGGSFFGGANPNLFGNSSTGSFPVTPTTPTAFETRNTGVTLEVEPVIGPDGYTIDLNLVPQVVEFEGFINYGSPIQSTQTNALGQQIVSVITPNVINQPIFSTRKVTTSVSVFDGSTVVLGGLMREDVQKVEDKIPLLGDIPLIGRLFRSSVDQHLKRNLVIFVSARLINAAGEPVHLEEEEEEVVEALAVPEVPVSELPLMPK
jgi:general secretion pathway protein D